MKIKIYDNLSQFELARSLHKLGNEICIIPPSNLEPIYAVENSYISDENSDLIMKLCTDDFKVSNGIIGYNNEICTYETNRCKMEKLFHGIFKVPVVDDNTKKFVVKNPKSRPKVQIIDKYIPNFDESRTYSFIEGVENTYCMWFDGENFIEPLFTYKEYKDPEHDNLTGYRQDCIGLTLSVQSSKNLNHEQNLAFKQLKYVLKNKCRGLVSFTTITDGDNNQFIIDLTLRLGKPTFEVLISSIKEPIDKVLYELSCGKSTLWSDLNNWPKFSTFVGVIYKGYPIKDLYPYNYECAEGFIHPFSIKTDVNWVNFFCAPLFGSLGKSSVSQSDACKKAYEKLEKLNLPDDLYYRKDIK